MKGEMKITKRLNGIIFAIIILFVSALSSYADTVTYVYDDLNRIIKEAYPDGTFVTYDYDKVGNKLSMIPMSITSTSGDNGAISLISYGNDMTFEMTPDTGYEVDDVLVDGSSVGAVTVYTFYNVSENHTISVTFKITCPNVRIVRAGSPVANYSTLLDAYNAAQDNDVIQSGAINLTENLTLNKPINLTIEGGYDCAYGNLIAGSFNRALLFEII